VIDLAQLRREIGVTQAELADRLGVKQAAVSKLERKTDILVSSLANYLEALGVDARITVTVGGRKRESELTNPTRMHDDPDPDPN
jgi:transcriptional regulator with XRE-family HTH domain